MIRKTIDKSDTIETMRKLFLLPVIVLALSACSTLKVSYDVDGSVDFEQYKTFEYYGWAEESDRILNRLDRERIEKSFSAEFNKRGMKYVKEDGDLIVVLFIVVEQKTDVSANTTSYGGGYYGGYGGYYGYGPGWGGMGMGNSTTTYSEYDYEVGTLVIDVFDKKGEKLIWEGIGTKTIDDNPQSRDKNVEIAVAAIMKNYPVKPIDTK